MLKLSASRRIELLVVLFSALLLNGLGPGLAGADAPTPKSKGNDANTIRIGFVASLSGVAAEPSEDMKKGFELYMEQIHHKIAGKDVEVIVENDESSPVTAMAAVKKLVEQDHCQILDGFILGNIGYAVVPVIEKEQVPTVFAIVASDDVTQRKRSKWVVRTGSSSSQPTQPFGEYAYKTLGYRRIACFGADYPFGWEVVGGFQKGFEEAGGKVIQKIWAPMGYTNLTGYIKQLNISADALFMQTLPAGTVQIPKELKAAGLKMPIIGGGTGFEETSLRHMGDGLIGVTSVLPYSTKLATPQNERFVAAYNEKYGQLPSWFSEGGYTSGMAIAKAIESVKGDVSDREKFLAALKHVELKDAPRGPFKLDEYANPIENIYVRRIEKVNDHLENTVVYTFKNIGQFWHWKPEEFLQQPVYSRDYPPCQYDRK